MWLGDEHCCQQCYASLQNALTLYTFMTSFGMHSDMNHSFLNFQPCGSHSFASSVHCWTQDLAKILESFWACYIRFSLGNKKLALSFLANDSYYEFHSSLKLGFLDVGLLYHRALKKALHPGFFRLLGSLSVLASSTGLIASNFKSSLFTCWKS